MSTNELKARAHRIAQELLTQGDLAVADELFAPDCNHRAPRPVPPGSRGMKVWVVALRRAFPDLRAIVEDEIAEGDRIALRLTLGGTHEAALFDVLSRGRHAAWPLVQMLRAGPDGTFVDHWSVWDELELRRQLSGTPTVPEEAR